MIKVLNYTRNPLTLMGICASVCYNSEPSPKIGIECIENFHHRVLEYPDVIVEIQGYSAKMIRELYTHIVGVTRLQESTRYVNYGGFEYVIPESINNNRDALSIYTKVMSEIAYAYSQLQHLDIPKEDISNILPFGMKSKMVLKINARAILHMAEVRLCGRAYWEYRNFMREFLNVVGKIDSEWEKIVTYAKPKCKVYGVCREKKPCKKGE